MSYAACRLCARQCAPRDDRLCGDCRKAAKKLDPWPESEVVLKGGRWVNDHGIQRWEPHR